MRGSNIPELTGLHHNLRRSAADIFLEACEGSVSRVAIESTLLRKIESRVRLQDGQSVPAHDMVEDMRVRCAPVYRECVVVGC